MKKQRFPLLIVLTLLFVCFTLGFFLGRNSGHETVVVSVPEATRKALPVPSAEAPEAASPVNINTAALDELMELPGIGQVYAQRILDYRKEHGSFSSTEELLNVKGIGEKRLEAIRDLITIGG